MGLSAFTTFAQLSVIHHSNAMVMIISGRATVITTWVFFMAWQGDGHQDFYWTSLVGNALVILGVWWFINIEINLKLPSGITKHQDYDALETVPLKSSETIKYE
jgi:hypothetical protein